MNRPAHLFLGLALLLSPIALQGQSTNQPASQAATPPTANPFLRALGNGVWWTNLTKDNKLVFVDGYITAMASVRQTLLILVDEDKKEFAAEDSQSDAHKRSLTYLTLLADQYDYGEECNAVVAGVNVFYNDPRNTRIGIEYALRYVRDILNGKKTPKDLEKQLNDWREKVNK